MRRMTKNKKGIFNVKNKKGELTSSQIGVLIIMLIGFVIVLFGLYEINKLYSKSAEEVCRLSIVEKATVPSQAQNYIPLKCTTKKICLSYDGKDCPEFLAEKNVENIKLPKDDATAAARMIEETMANAQYDCWSMTGEGEIDLTTGISTDPGNVAPAIAGQFLLGEGTAKPACLVCSRIALGADVQKDTNMLQQVNVPKYMKKTKVPTTDLTYLETFTDKQISDYPAGFTESLQQPSEKHTKQVAYIFTQVLTSDKDAIEQGVKAGTHTGIATGASFLFSPLGKFVGIKGTLVATVVSGSISGGLAWYNAKQNQAFANTFCGKLTSAQSASKKDEQLGCTVITPADYDDTTLINKLCSGGILGSP